MYERNKNLHEYYITSSVIQRTVFFFVCSFHVLYAQIVLICSHNLYAFDYNNKKNELFHLLWLIHLLWLYNIFYFSEKSHIFQDMAYAIEKLLSLLRSFLYTKKKRLVTVPWFTTCELKLNKRNMPHTHTPPLKQRNFYHESIHIHTYYGYNCKYHPHFHWLLVKSISDGRCWKFDG